MLPASFRRPLMERMQVVTMKVHHPVYDDQTDIRHVYFPIQGVVSLLATMNDGSAVEVGTVGNEGMAGLPAFLGASRTPGRAFQQIAGSAYRLDVPALRELTPAGSPFTQLLHRYTQAFFVQVSQATACNRLHPAEERLARWLLMCRDRVGSHEFTLTHEFLGQMLGVRRATVTVIAGMLQEAGIIRYRRGRVTIVNRERLEEASCECYGIVKAEYDRLLTPIG